MLEYLVVCTICPSEVVKGDVYVGGKIWRSRYL